MNYIEVKSTLYQNCLDWIDQKISITSKAVKDAQDSANNEEKSSAGDKYETGRAMSQNQRDMYAKQLAECNKQKQLLLAIDSTKSNERISNGSLVLTDNANYFISISAGAFVVEDKTYFAVSSETPVAILLHSKTVGDQFLLNGKNIKINSIL